MKEFFATFTLIALLLTACNKQKYPTPPQASLADKSEANCFTLCHTKLKKLCPDSSISLDSCTKQCNTWTDSTIACMDSAVKCDQINFKEGTCRSEDLENPYVYEKEKEINYTCSKACYNYKKCTSYADDDTQTDRDSAYNTCFQECQNWSKKTVDCMSSFRMNSTMDCVKVSQCGLAEYLGQ